LLAAVPAWTQVEPSATGGASVSDENAQMTTPPPVSGEAYSTTTGSEERSNYFGFGINLSPAYDDNVLSGSTSKPVGDVNYLISPSLTLDLTTARQHEAVSYNPGFNLYQPTTALNSINQSVAVAYQYRLSPEITVHLGYTFLQTSNIFNQSPIFSGTGISGSAPAPATTVIAPFAEQRSNTVNGNLSYQFSKDGMIGGGANFSTFSFPNPSQAAGLYNSQSTGASAFFARRLTAKQYVGVGYQYSRVFAYLPGAPIETQAHSLAPYYTFALSRQVSFSVSGGVLHYSNVEPGTPTTAAWTPTASASVGWQKSKSAFAASFSRSVSAGQGLVGAFTSSSINGSGNWRLGRTWGAGLVASYSRTKNAAKSTGSSYPGGDTLSAGASLQHSLTERINASVGYQRLHESYSAIPTIATAPDSDREYISISYQFSRPIGR
jgi:hypothetical protein